MKTFAEKVKDARLSRGFTQPQLAETMGVSVQTIVSYETNKKLPRASSMLKLAQALGVSVKFLSDESCENPMEDIEKDDYIAVAREKYGEQGGLDVEQLLSGAQAYFAGGDVPQEDKDKFFEAMMKAYVYCKEQGAKRSGDSTTV